MIGTGESFFVAYALSLGYTQLQAGIIVTVPIFIGGILQMVSPYGINFVKSYKTWTVVGAFLQACIFLIFVFFSHTLTTSFILLFVLVSLYWSLSLGITPSWNSWISSYLKPEQIRTFFPQRNIILALGTLTGLLLSGLSLQYAPKTIWGIKSFSVLFLFCFLFRFLSSLCLLFHPNVEFKKLVPRLSTEVPENPFIKRFIRYSALFKLGVYFSASFFAPYMIKQLKFSYIEFSLVLTSAFLGRAFFSHYLKKRLENLDINRVYLLASTGISFIPLLWIFFANFEFIFLLEIITGMLWGAFEVAFYIICFEVIPTQDQSKVISRYNFLHTIAIGIGSLSGLWLFSRFEANAQTYYMIFAISSLLRFSTLLYFPQKIIFASKKIPMIFMRVLAVRPNMGSIIKPMWQVMRKMKK